jgi:hypothetical protein
MTRVELVNNALSDLGLTEDPPGSNKVKYNDWYYEGTTINAAWCATAVSYWYFHSDHPLPHIDTDNGFGYVPTLYVKGKKNGWETMDPKHGDVFIIDFNGDGKWDHTGLFIGWYDQKKTKFWTVEGNTSPDEKGSQSNGGMVCRKVRTYNPDKVKFYNLYDEELNFHIQKPNE